MQFLNQVRKNSLSIISLVIALSALSYNTYRNELTEMNRNIRSAGFEVLKELNQLQLLIDYSHYDKNVAYGNPIHGWAYVSYIQDMSQLVSENALIDANALRLTWKNNWMLLKEQKSSNNKITHKIDKLRVTIKDEMISLR